MIHKYLLSVVLGMISFPLFAQNNIEKVIEFNKLIENKSFEAARNLFAPNVKDQISTAVFPTIIEQINTVGKGNVSSYEIISKDSNEVTIMAHWNYPTMIIKMMYHFDNQQLLDGFRMVGVQDKSKEQEVLTDKLSKIVGVNVGDGTLYGTFKEAMTSDKHLPLVIMIAGSGPTDRNGNNNMGLLTNNFMQLADSLSNHNIHSYRYDKRLIGQSTDFKLGESALQFDMYILDVVKIINHFEALGYHNIYVAGHSEGALIGLNACLKKKVKGYISICGMANDMGTTIEQQLKSNPDVDPKLLSESTKIIKALKSGNKVETISNDLMVLFRPEIQPYLMSAFKHHPAQEIKSLQVPSLIIGGGADLQVSDADATILKQNAIKSSKLLIIKDLNHVLKQVDPSDKTANMATYNNGDLGLHPGFVKAMINFIK